MQALLANDCVDRLTSGMLTDGVALIACARCAAKRGRKINCRKLRLNHFASQRIFTLKIRIARVSSHEIILTNNKGCDLLSLGAMRIN